MTIFCIWIINFWIIKITASHHLTYKTDTAPAACRRVGGSSPTEDYQSVQACTHQCQCTSSSLYSHELPTSHQPKVEERGKYKIRTKGNSWLNQNIVNIKVLKIEKPHIDSLCLVRVYSCMVQVQYCNIFVSWYHCSAHPTNTTIVLKRFTLLP